MRRAKGPRLDLETRNGRPSLWRIRDGEKTIRTGLLESQRAEAEQRLAEYLSEKHEPSLVKAAPGEISIPEVLAYYHRTLIKKAARKKTAATGHGIATRLIHIDNLLTFWSDRTLADVRTSVCEKYEAHRQAMPPRRGMRKGAQSVSSATVRQELKTLEHAIKVWHGESPLPALPIVWKPDPAPARVRFLERDEVARMLRSARKLRFPHVVRFILIGIYTATRDDAMRRLRWMRASHDGYVDTVRGILYRAGFGEQQTTKARPPMVIPDRLLAHLRRWERIDRLDNLTHVITYAKPAAEHPNAIRRAERLGRGYRQPQPVGDIHKAWASTVKAAGLGPDVTPHTLKHTAISWMLWEGRNPWEVSEDTGTSLKTIQDVYGHHRKVESRLERGKNARQSGA